MTGDTGGDLGWVQEAQRPHICKRRVSQQHAHMRPCSCRQQQRQERGALVSRACDP